MTKKLMILGKRIEELKELKERLKGQERALGMLKQDKIILLKALHERGKKTADAETQSEKPE